MSQATFDTREGKVAIDITNIALAHAANAISFMVGENASFSPAAFNEMRLAPPAKSDKIYTVLFTPFIGEVLQESFLVLDPQDASNLADALTPSPGKDDRIRNAALLEIDNIMSAAVATQLSNILDQPVIGDVPRVLLKHDWEVLGFLSQRVKMNANGLHCGVTFQLHGKKIEAYYLCIFKPSFSALAKTFASKPLQEQIIADAYKPAAKFMK